MPRGEQEEHGEHDHEGRDHDAHAEDASVHELDDVEVGLGGEDILHAQDERGREVGERPDEDEQRPRDVARRGERQRHRPELPPAPGPDALRRLLERGVDLREGVDDVEGDHRKQVERLDQHDAVKAVQEVDGPEHVEGVHQENVHGTGPPENEGEAQDPDERRGDDGDHGEIAEHVPAPEVAADEEERDGDAERRGRDDGREAEDERVPERSQVEVIGEELAEVGEGQPARLVGHRVVEDPAQRVDEEQDQERPDQPDPDPQEHARPRRRPAERHLRRPATHRHRAPPFERRRGESPFRRSSAGFAGAIRFGGGGSEGAPVDPGPPPSMLYASSETASVTDAGKLAATSRPMARGSWCQGSRMSALRVSPLAVSRS